MGLPTARPAPNNARATFDPSTATRAPDRFSTSVKGRPARNSVPVISKKFGDAPSSSTVSDSFSPARATIGRPSTKGGTMICAPAAATAVPRSLCGWTESSTRSRSGTVRPNHSMTSAYTLGVYTSTVDGRLTTIFRSGVGSMTSMTARQISAANSGSVAVKLSGEYS